MAVKAAANTALLTLGDLKIEVEYKRVKHLRLTVYPPEGRVRISAPLHATAGYIRGFAASKQQWIEKCRAKYRSRARTGGGVGDRAVQYVWGRAFELEVVEGRFRPRVVLEGPRLTMYVRPGSTAAKRRELLDRWYRRLIGEAAPPLARKWEGPLGVAVKGLYFRKMKTRWGSCNCQRGTLRLNTELAKRSPECLEYVIVHEMVHLLEPSHNRNFYRLMDQFMPQWKTIRKKMNAGEL